MYTPRSTEREEGGRWPTLAARECLIYICMYVYFYSHFYNNRHMNISIDVEVTVKRLYLYDLYTSIYIYLPIYKFLRISRLMMIIK